MECDDLAEKVRFQDSLSRLDDTDDDTTPAGKFQSLLRTRPISPLSNLPASSTASSSRGRAQTSERWKGRPEASTCRTSLVRPWTAPSSSSVATSTVKEHHHADGLLLDGVAETPVHTSKVRPGAPILRTALTMPNNLPSYQPTLEGALPRGTNKRKRAVIKLAPERLRIFAGLVFFFVRNNDINAARRMRICKAIEYGAAWAHEWHRAVTHIIVDQNLLYDDVLIELRSSSLTELPCGVVLVNETYASDCIAFRHLLNPQQHMYKVAGCRARDVNMPLDLPEDVMSQQSLQLKQARGREALGAEAAEPHTNPRSESSQSSHQLRTELHRRPSDATTIVSTPHTGSRDELDDVIDSVKATENLPLDSDDENNPQTIIEETSSEDESADERPTSRLKSKLDKPAAGFQCLQKSGDEIHISPNQEVIDILQQMATYYDSIHDTWRTLSYRKAIATFRRTNQRITTAAEAVLLPAIGQRLADKIEEIAVTHRLRRLESTHDDPTDTVLRKFLAIYGVGVQQAMRWIQQGHRSLEDLLAHASLSTNQRIGIAHAGDFATRIPRDEVARLGAIVTSALHNIDPTFQVTIGGSYRRGATTSGDIDLVITRPDTEISHIRTVVLESLVPRLFRQGFLTAALAATNRDTGTKWHGACQLPALKYPSPVTATLEGLQGNTAMPVAIPNPWRRIDLLLVPWSELGAAMIYFTGSDIFNRSMRLLARKRGMGLNQKGLFKNVLRGPGQAKLAEGELVESHDERRIFEVLGVPWRTPAERQI